jgi:cell wall-associated NlpC family hydrolase
LTIRTLTLTAVLLTTVAAVAETTYTVHRGETLKRISQKLGIPVEALEKANGLSSDHLRRGQVLTIPNTKAEAPKAAPVLGTAQILPESVTPHAGPFVGSKSLDVLLKGDSFAEIDQKGGWVKLQLPSGTGWLPSETVAITPAPVLALATPVTDAVKTVVPTPKETVVEKVAKSNNSLLKKAMTYRGVRYRWGGTSRSSGVDCSGFTTSVFKSQGIDLPRTSIEQSHVGKAVAKSDLKPGDLVFFRTSRSIRINHVGIYVGDGKFIHAATGAGHVMVSSLDEAYFARDYVTARRVADFNTASHVAEESQKAIEN